MNEKSTDTKTSPIRMIFNGFKMNAALLVAFGYDWALETKSYSIGDSLTIGRSPDCDLVIKEYGVSSLADYRADAPQGPRGRCPGYFRSYPQ
jgi:hypothetical protein